MGLVHKLRNKTKEVKREEKNIPVKLLKYFYAMEGTDSYPLSHALTSLDSISKNAKSTEDYLLCLLEDSVFASLYVTFYEQIFSTVRDNPEHMESLIKNFAADREERENAISIQSHNHLVFIEKNGKCEGCISCDNHDDVAELIQFWKNKDISFFENLYVGMQTIQFSMEHLLYEVIPSTEGLVEDLSPSNILTYRQEIFNYTAKFI